MDMLVIIVEIATALFVCLSVCLCMSVSLFVCLSVCLSVCLKTHAGIVLSVRCAALYTVKLRNKAVSKRLALVIIAARKQRLNTLTTSNDCRYLTQLKRVQKPNVNGKSNSLKHTAALAGLLVKWLPRGGAAE